MKNKPKQTPSRRKFLSLGLLGGAALFTQDVQAQNPPADDGETVKMLTQDGKLVEISRQVLNQSVQRSKAGNKDILDWTQSHKSPK